MMADVLSRAAKNFIKKKQKFLLAKAFTARQNDTVRYLRIVNGANGCCVSR
jgi:hypothetical protein